MVTTRISSGVRNFLTRLRAAYSPLVLLVLFGAVFLRVLDPPFIAQFRLQVFDAFQRIAPRASNPDKPVIIIDIDDESLKRIGQWPWPRNMLAALLAGIRQSGAAAVGVDFVFPEPDRLSPEQVIKDWPTESGLADLRRVIAKLTPHDEIFANEISKGRVVLGFIMSNRRGSGKAPVSRTSFAFAGTDPKKLVPAFPQAISSLAILSKAAMGSGFLNWIPDRDQVVRRIPLLARVGDELYPAMAIDTLRVAQDASTYIVKSSGASGVQSFGQDTGVDSLRVGSGIVPVNPDGEMLIHFAYRDRSRYISAWKVLANKVDMTALAGRIVLIGTSAAGLFDMRATPLESAVPGIEVHAQAIEQVIDGRFLYRPDYSLGVEVFYMIVVALVMIFLLPRAGAAWSALIGTGIVLAVTGTSYSMFVKMGWLVDPVYPTLSALAVYLTGSAIVYLHSETQRRQIRAAFSYYLSPPLVEQLAAEPERLVLGGELRTITTLFADVRGFTAISEGLSSPELISLINKVLTPTSDAILEHKGTIDKYMGDAVMAFWNAPLDDPQHARNAALAALDIQKNLAVLNAELRAEARARGHNACDIGISVGLNTGPCSVGNMGTEYRFDYSVIGDNVNIASRLEGQTREYGVDILIAASTAENCGDLAVLELDLIRVKGKSKAVRIYALAGDDQLAQTDRFRQLQHAQSRMLSAYRAKDWDAAMERLKDCRARAQGEFELLFTLYETRIARYRKTPPPEDWDGSYTALTK